MGVSGTKFKKWLTQGRYESLCQRSVETSCKLWPLPLLVSMSSCALIKATLVEW